MDRPRYGPHRRSYDRPGHAHELTFTCHGRYPFLKAERTCRWLADSIEAARHRPGFQLWAFVFMPEHVHLIVHPGVETYSTAAILKAIKAPVARRAIAHLEAHAPHWLPRITRTRGGRVERLFWKSGGGFDRNVTEPATLARMIDYIHLNPVRHGLVERPTDWRWSSAGHQIGMPTCDLIPDPIPWEWGLHG